MLDSTYHWLALPSGLRLAAASLPRSECASLAIYVPAGSRHENGVPAGIAHFLEHMVFKGTATRGARELSLVIEGAGGQLNACTSEDHIVYEGRAEADQLPLLAEVLSDMIWHADFPESEIELERDVISEEIISYRENPADHIGDLISAALWEPHPLGRPISGTLESIREIDRPALLAFRGVHHFRNDIVVAAAGPFSLEDLRAVMEPLLPSSLHPADAPPPFRPVDHPPRQLTETRDTDQLQLALARPGPP